MSRITVTEREHWKTRISRKIEKAIERFWSQNRTLKAELMADARKIVIDHLNIEKEMQQLHELIEERCRINGELRALEEVLGKALGLSRYESCHEGVDRQIDNRTREAFNELVESHPVASQVHALAAEQEELLDTVWLATSTKQIKQLWERFSETMADPMTPLQKQAIDLEPVAEE